MENIVEYYDELAGKYDQDRFGNSYGKFIDKQERKVLDKMLSSGHETVLDLACGSGRLSACATIGADASLKMLEIATTKFPDKKFIHCDVSDIPLESNSIDSIISFHFFMHLNAEKVDHVFEECHRILNDDGRLIFDIPSKKRRKAINFKANNWHGTYSLNLSDLQKNSLFRVKTTYGIMLLPIHRFPTFMRKFLVAIDFFLANSFLKSYSSYLVVEFEKK
jgi:ubiquinone/menaquinone biosynthesis C-methylase UbiE